MDRRTFLTIGLGAATVSAFKAASPRILLGFDTYSLTRLGWKGIQLLDFAAAQELDTIQFSSPGDYESLEPAYLQKVKDHAARLGIVVESGANSICPSSSSWDKRNGDPIQYVRRCLRAAKAVGANIMRCYLGSGSDRRGPIPIEGHVENIIKTMRAVRSEALDLGVKFAVENHAGDLLAREMRTLITEVGTDLAGACLDTGNPVWMAEDPLLTMEVLGPYAISTHIRDSVVFEHTRGAAVQWVALGDGSIDLQTLMELYRKLCPKAAFHHEVITGSGPRVLNYNEPEFWQAYPKMPAADFARFLDLVRKGHPLMAPMLIPGRGANLPPEYQAAVRVQARVDLERSLEYSKKTLDVGVRWRG